MKQNYNKNFNPKIKKCLILVIRNFTLLLNLMTNIRLSSFIILVLKINHLSFNFGKYFIRVPIFINQAKLLILAILKVCKAKYNLLENWMN